MRHAALSSLQAPARCRQSRTLRTPHCSLVPPRALSTTAAAVKFVKFQGLGNDFILVDNRNASEPCMSPEQAVHLCDRNFGIGGDGVIFALRRREAESDYSMRIFNSDGSEPEMCGNGIRCLARFVASLDAVSERTYRIDTGAGVIVPAVRADGQVSVDMGRPVLEAARVPCTLAPNHSSGGAVRAPLAVGSDTWRTTAVSMGNPHSVVFAMPDGSPINLDTLPLAAMGPSFEHHPAFPKRTNTEFVTVLSRNRLRMRVWERGAGATLACGTGACATVVAAVLEGLADRRCVVDLPGGPLDIHWRESDDRIIMTGPAVAVFSGVVDLP